jgi:hypothetical protein
MIRVSSKPEYPGFDAEVRSPGAAYLATCPTPTSEQFKKRNFWSRAAPELHAAYSGVCAYTAMYLPERGTVDHFLPKTTHPHLAYEWSNFRLASGRVNSSKGNLTDVLDPFHVQDDWFYIDIPACLLKPNPALEKSLRTQIASTINSLRLNQDDNYVQERCNILMEYARGDVSENFLERRYPFLAKEVSRQGLDQQTLKDLFKM